MNKKDKPVVIWLLAGCLLIFLMVVIGGITRLTNSGLSMVDWKLIMGMVPPMNEAEWVDTFDKYQQFPEYQQVNFTFTLEEFKAIFFWEYLHRMIGRFIGVVFIIPFIVFLIQKRLSKKVITQSVVLLGMGAFQGFLGWWMVKSGLVNDPDVSHYRLAIHLITAFITFAYTLWVALGIIYKSNKQQYFKQPRNILIVLLLLVVIQIIYGAFVAGLNAGFVMNTYPKMGNQWVSDSVTIMQPMWVNFVNGIGGVQFVHRVLAHVVVALIIYLLILSVKFSINSLQRNSLYALIVVVSIQFILGVFTLLFAVPIVLGVLHQVGAFLLLGTVVFSLFQFRKSVVV